VWSLLALQQYSPSLISLPASLTSAHWLLEHATINLATVTTLIYVITYLIMDPIAGGEDRQLSLTVVIILSFSTRFTQ
jgi:hypothetical protein